MADLSYQDTAVPTPQETEFIISDENSRRITSLRFFLILFVVLLHNYDAILDFLQPDAPGGLLNPTFFDVLKKAPLLFLSVSLGSCAVPLFFTFTSYFQNAKHYSYCTLLKKKFYSLIVPYTLWFVLVILVQILPRLFLNIFFPSHTSDPSYIPFISKWDFFDWIKAFTGYNFRSGEPFLDSPYIVPFWFMRDLIILTLLAPVLRFLTEKFPFLFLGVLCANLVFFQRNYYILLDSSLFFYTVGLYLARYRNKIDIFAAVDKIKWIEIMPIVIVSWYVYLVAQRPPAARALSALSAGVVFLKASKYLISKEKIYKFLEFTSKYTFFVYAIHKPILMRLVNKAFHIVIRSKCLPALYLQYIVVGFGTFASGLLIAIAVKKICPKLFGLLNGGR